MNSLRSLTSAILLSASFLCASSSAFAQASIEPKSAEQQTATSANYSKEQILTATVHQAWELSGKNEANFFEIVEQLAAISASNRGITLPDTEAAGRKIGDYIKRSAKADTDQLLFAVVDKAVRMTSTKPVHVAGQPRQ